MRISKQKENMEIKNFSINTKDVNYIIDSEMKYTFLVEKSIS